MNKYLKPKIDLRGQPEYWSKEFFPEFVSNDDYVYPKVYSIESIEEKVIYLHWLKDEYLPKNISDQWEFYFTEIATDIKEALKELKELMGNKGFYAVNKKDDFQIKNEFYGRRLETEIILNSSEVSLIHRIIKYIGPKHLIYINALNIYLLSSGNITYKKALSDSLKRFKKYFPELSDLDTLYDTFKKWKDGAGKKLYD